MTELDEEQLLERFRRWLEQTRLEAAAPAAVASPGDIAAPAGAAESPAFGLYRLAEEFTALRHEIKLQTRSTRGLEEDVEKLLAALNQSLEALRSIEPKEAAAAWSAGKSLALALTDLDEALDRGSQQLHSVGARLVEEPRQSLWADLEQAYAGQTWLGRRLTRRYHERLRACIEHNPLQSRQDLFAALREGYLLIRRRLTTALAAEGVVRIATLGEAVDPERMVVLELVDGDGPPGTVVEEVRRGYVWNGRLLRCAEVRVTRANSYGDGEQ